MPSSVLWNSAPRFSEGGEGEESALLGLHAAGSSSELGHALTDMLRTVGLPGRWTIVFREVSHPGRTRVFLSSLSGVDVGATVELADDVLVDGYGPGDTPLSAQGTSPHRPAVALTCHLVLPLVFGTNRYGSLLIHDIVGEHAGYALERLGEHLGVALFMLQAAQERSRLHDLDTRKLSLMMQATNVVLRELDLERSLVKLIELTVNSIGGEVGCISLAGSGDGLTGLRYASWGIDEAALGEMRLLDGRPVHEVVSAGGMTCLFRNPEELQELRPCAALAGLFSLAALPVYAARGVRGCLLVANAPAIDQVEMELLRLATEVCATAIDNALRHQFSLERESLREQLRLAGDIQQALLPDQAPDVPGVDLYGCNVPCDDSSGDYYDFFTLGSERVGFVVADATGHGIGAALIATTARAALRALLFRREDAGGVDLADVLEQLNALAESDMADDKFITLFIGVYDTRNRTLTYASAGHDPPLLVCRGDTAQIEHLEATGLPLAMFPGSRYEAATIAPLAPGDYLLVATDGVNEARNGAGAQFGLQRLEDLLREARGLSAAQVVNRVIDEHQAFTELRQREDDITMICLRATA